MSRWVDRRNIGAALGATAGPRELIGYIVLMGLTLLGIALCSDHLLTMAATPSRVADPARLTPPLRMASTAPARPSPVRAAKPAAPSPTIRRTGFMVPTTDDWAEKLLDPNFWARNRVGKSSFGTSSSGLSRLGITPVERTPAPRVIEPVVEDTVRTVCVRLCDGSFFPISFATTRDNVAADAETCARTCPGARLYLQPNSETLDDLEAVDGTPYTALPNAFRFRTTYDPMCRCRPQPWDEAARAEHRQYAIAEAKARSQRIAAQTAAAEAAERRTAARERERASKRAAAKAAAHDKASARAARIAAAAAAKAARAAGVKSARASQTGRVQLQGLGGPSLQR